MPAPASRSATATPGTSAPGTAPTSAALSTSPSAESEPLALPLTAVDAQPKRSDSSGDAGLTVTGIRFGGHPGFARVVYDLSGPGIPGWFVRYTDRAFQDASGRPVAVAGTSILEVAIRGSAFPSPNDPVYTGPGTIADPNVPVIAGIYQTAVFEGDTQSFIGINAQRPAFSVITLTNPTRLVVDIATP